MDVFLNELTLVNRKDAAHILGISVSMLKKYDADRIYPFILDSRGVHWYDPKDLDKGNFSFRPKGKQGHSKRESPLAFVSGLTAKVTLSCFDLFKKGHTFEEVIRKTQYSPDLVMRAMALYRHDDGGFFLDKNCLARMAELPWIGVVEMESPTALYKLLERNLSGPSICEHCKKRVSKLCLPCAKGEGITKLPAKPCALCMKRVAHLCKPCALGDETAFSQTYRQPTKGRLTKKQRIAAEILAAKLQRQEAEMAAALKLREEIRESMAKQLQEEAETKIRAEYAKARAAIEAEEATAPSEGSDSAPKAAAP